MDQETAQVADAAVAPAEDAAPAPIKGKFLFTDPTTGQVYRLDKYPMPRKAPRFPMTVNGNVVDAAQTTFGEIKYTYFEFNGIGFQIPAHVDAGPDFIFTYPADYSFTEKSNARIQMNERAKVRAAEAKAKAGAEQKPVEGSAPESPESKTESPLDSAETAGSTAGTEPASDAPVEPAATEGKKGKKAQR